MRERYDAEIDKLGEFIQKSEAENNKMIVTLKSYENEIHKAQLKIVELTESLKVERITFERTKETIAKEKDLEVSKIIDELSSLKQELSKAESTNLGLR